MKYCAVQFYRGEKPSGRPYTYKSEIDLSLGMKVRLPGGKKGYVMMVLEEGEVAPTIREIAKEITAVWVEEENNGNTDNSTGTGNEGSGDCRIPE